MKRLLIAIILAGLAWSGHWFWAAHHLRGQTEAWFDARRADGWTAQYDELAILGFPNRLDATLGGVTLADPATGIRWQAPFLQIFRLSYSAGHLILVWPEEHTLTTPSGTTTLSDEGLRASLVLDGDAVMRSNLEARSLDLETPAGAFALTDLTAAFAHVDAATYRLAVHAMTGMADAAEISMDATLTFETPVTAALFGGPRPQPTRIALRLLEYRTGEMSLKLSGEIDLDDAGLASGTLSLRTTNWHSRDTPGPLAGLLAPLEQALALDSAPGGDAGTRDLTLLLSDGALSLGQVPVGRLPALRLP